MLGVATPLGAALLSGPWTPARLPGLALWLDASDAATLRQNSDGTTAAAADTDPVGCWADKSGYGRHATQAVSAGRRPVTRTGVQNGLSVVRFDGVDDFLTAAASLDNGTGGWAAFLVVASTATAAGFQGALTLNEFANNSNYTYLSLQDTTTAPAENRFAVTNAASAVGEVGSLPGFHLYTLGHTGTQQSYQRDGGAAGVLTAAAASSHDTVSLGALWRASGIAGPCPCDVAELLIYTRWPPAADRLAVEAYLRAKWGTP